MKLQNWVGVALIGIAGYLIWKGIAILPRIIGQAVIEIPKEITEITPPPIGPGPIWIPNICPNDPTILAGDRRCIVVPEVFEPIIYTPWIGEPYPITTPPVVIDPFLGPIPMEWPCRIFGWIPGIKEKCGGLL